MTIEQSEALMRLRADMYDDSVDCVPVVRECFNDMKAVVLMALAEHPADAPGNTAVADAVELEQARWQEAIYDLLTKLSGDNSLDGSGCDSGDPLDVTLTEISLAWNGRHDDDADLFRRADNLIRSGTMPVNAMERCVGPELERLRKRVVELLPPADDAEPVTGDTDV